jgi:hypothetical protein
MEPSKEEEVQRSLEEELKIERERADRAMIEAQIAWEANAIIREFVVQHRLNITMLGKYEFIRQIEDADGLQREISRRLEEKRKNGSGNGAEKSH